MQPPTPTPLTVLITGSNRGIGLGLCTLYLTRPFTTVLASVRNPSTASSLHSLPRAPSSKLIILPLDMSSTTSITSAITTLPTTHNITHLSVVIANAGIAGPTPLLSAADTAEIQTYIDVNALAQLELYKAVLPFLLNASKKGEEGKFVYVSSTGGSIGAMNTQVPLAEYGASKALGNFLFRWLALEQGTRGGDGGEGEEEQEAKVVVWCQDPGIVATDMGKAGIEIMKDQGVDASAHVISMEQSTQGIKKVIETASFEHTNGKFLGPDGEELAW